MDDQIPFGLIAKYLEGDTSPEEEAKVGRWLEEDARHVQWLAELTAQWFASPNPPPLAPGEMEAAWARLQARTVAPPRRPFPWLVAASLAALLAVLGGMLWPWGSPADTWMTFTNTSHETLTVALPDNSQVSLRPNSTIQFPEMEAYLADRRVKIEGEAYVQVQAGASTPLRVLTEHTSIAIAQGQALVSSAARQGEATVAMAEGSADISFRKQHFACQPGQKITIDPATHAIRVADTFDQNSLAWYTGDLRVQRQGLADLLRQLANELEMPLGAIPATLQDTLVSGNYLNYDPAEVLMQLLTQYNLQLQPEADKINLIIPKSS